MTPKISAHLKRWHMPAARRSLAARFDLPYHDQMQDWEWEVSKPSLLPALLAAYKDAALSDDERSSLMECMVQAVADLSCDLADASAPSDFNRLPPEWADVAACLRAEPSLHASIIAYWSDVKDLDARGWGVIGEAMAALWAELAPALGSPDD